MSKFLIAAFNSLNPLRLFVLLPVISPPPDMSILPPLVATFPPPVSIIPPFDLIAPPPDEIAPVVVLIVAVPAENVVPSNKKLL